MNDTKYAKYVMREPIDPARFGPAVHVFGENLGGLNCSMVWNCINGPLLMEDKPHKHDFDQLLCFL